MFWLRDFSRFSKVLKRVFKLNDIVLSSLLQLLQFSPFQLLSSLALLSCKYPPDRIGRKHNHSKYHLRISPV